MIPFMGNIQNRQSHRNRNYTSGCQGLEEGRKEGDCVFEISFWGDENALELDSDDNCMTLCIY